MQNILLYISIFLVPIAAVFQMKGTIVWYPQILVVIWLGLLLGAAWIWKFNKPLGALSAYCSFSYMVVCHQHPRAMMLLMVCYAGMAIVYAFSQIKDTQKIYNSIVAMAVLQFGLIILQRFNIDPLFRAIGNQNACEIVGFIGSHNQMGIYYAAIAPMLFHLCMPLLLLSVMAIVWAHSSSAMAGVFISLVVYVFAIRARYILFIMLPAILIAGFMFSRFDNTQNVALKRMELWKQTIEQLSVGKVNMDMGKGVHQIKIFSPLTGAGMGNFMSYSPPSQGEKIFGKGWNYAQTPRWEHAHNDFVEFIFDYGWLGLPILLWLIFDILIKFITAIKTNMLVVAFSSLVAQAVTSMGVYVIHAPVSYFMLCLTLGLFYAECNIARKKCATQ